MQYIIELTEEQNSALEWWAGISDLKDAAVYLQYEVNRWINGYLKEQITARRKYDAEEVLRRYESLKIENKDIVEALLYPEIKEIK